MIQDGGFNYKVYMDEILSLLAEWDAEYFMDTPSTFNMKESYTFKSQIHHPGNPKYM